MKHTRSFRAVKEKMRLQNVEYKQKLEALYSEALFVDYKHEMGFSGTNVNFETCWFQTWGDTSCRCKRCGKLVSKAYIDARESLAPEE